MLPPDTEVWPVERLMVTTPLSESNLAVVDGVDPGAAVVVVEVHEVIVDDPIVAVAGVDRVGAALRIDHIIAAESVDDVGVARARQIVSEVGALQILEIEDRVALREPAGACAGGEVDGNSSRRIVEHHPVDAVAAVEMITAAFGVDHVVAVAAEERVGLGIADQRVGVLSAADVLNIDQRVALGVAAAACSARQVHVHACGGKGIVGRVHPGAAVEVVGAAAALERVVAVLAIESVGAAAALERVVAAAGGAKAITAVKGVVAVAAGERVVAAAALEDVVQRCCL